MGSSATMIVNEGKARQPSVDLDFDLSERIALFPELRYMGSKRRLLPWIHDVVNGLDFDSAWDPFSGSGCVSYLFKAMGKRVVATDFLNFPTTIAQALIANPGKRLEGKMLAELLEPCSSALTFIEDTWKGIFFSKEDLKFLDHISARIQRLDNEHCKALAMSALLRSCLKRQPRGVFTISGDLSRYDDGRRDLRLSIREHFIEQVEVFNRAVFSNQRRNRCFRQDVFDSPTPRTDLVYLDPPYVPRSDDNCYIKRYHFLEGLSLYWKGMEIDFSTKVRKMKKRYTPFSYRRTAIDAFKRLFKRCGKATIVLSYSSNGFPDLDILVGLMEGMKNHVSVHQRIHKYHFGTHKAVKRSNTIEYAIVGRS